MTLLHRLGTAVLRGVLLVLLLGVVGLQAGRGTAAAAASPASEMRPGAAATAPSSPQSFMADTQAEQPVQPPSSDALSDGPSEVVEVLRLQVPARSRQAWLEAEQASWEPWLARQDGFLGRQLFWDPQREEGLLLIRWASRAQWKAIPPDTVAAVQERFEQHARRLTGSSTNPFPLLFEAELLPL